MTTETSGNKKTSLMDLIKKSEEGDTKTATHKDKGNKEVARERTKQQIVRMYPDAHKALKLLAIEKETSVNTLLTKAINNLFQENGKDPIA